MTNLVSTERDLLLRMLANQRTAFRRAVSGITEEQARSLPSASEMSLAALLKHVIDGEISTVDRISGELFRPAAPDPVAAWLAAWQVGADETVDSLLAGWDLAADRTERVVRAEPDLGRALELRPEVARWFPSDVECTVRYLLLHAVEELARHAGHADIIRESVDGATAAALSG